MRAMAKRLVVSSLDQGRIEDSPHGTTSGRARPRDGAEEHAGHDGGHGKSAGRGPTSTLATAMIRRDMPPALNHVGRQDEERDGHQSELVQAQTGAWTISLQWNRE